MNLLLDLGNSRLKWATSAYGHLLARGSMASEQATAGDLGPLAAGGEGVSALWLASVGGPDRDAELIAALERRWRCPLHRVQSVAGDHGVRNAYDQPERLGVDRWLTLIAAHTRNWAPCCIVDCGTAVTLDGLAGDGRHLGGVILPGARLMRQALYHHTGRIPAEAGERARVFGTTTRDGVLSGTVLGAAAAVDALAEAQLRDLGAGARVLLTGGGVDELRPHLRGRYQEEPDLVLLGLQTVAGGA